MEKDIQTGIENGMIWGFAIGGLYAISSTIYHIFILWMEHGWDGILFYFGLFGLFIGLGMLGLSAKWQEEQAETSKPQ